jgi:ribosomal protein S21
MGEPISKKSITKKGLVEWLKVKALSSNPSTARKKKKRRIYREGSTGDCVHP